MAILDVAISDAEAKNRLRRDSRRTGDELRNGPRGIRRYFAH
jgi:hypothetical protein